MIIIICIMFTIIALLVVVNSILYKVNDQ